MKLQNVHLSILSQTPLGERIKKKAWCIPDSSLPLFSNPLHIYISQHPYPPCLRPAILRKPRPLHPHPRNPLKTRRLHPHPLIPQRIGPLSHKISNSTPASAAHSNFSVTQSPNSVSHSSQASVVSSTSFSKTYEEEQEEMEWDYSLWSSFNLRLLRYVWTSSPLREHLRSAVLPILIAAPLR